MINAIYVIEGYLSNNLRKEGWTDIEIQVSCDAQIYTSTK